MIKFFKSPFRTYDKMCIYAHKQVRHKHFVCHFISLSLSLLNVTA